MSCVLVLYPQHGSIFPEIATRTLPSTTARHSRTLPVCGVYAALSMKGPCLCRQGPSGNTSSPGTRPCPQKAVEFPFASVLSSGRGEHSFWTVVLLIPAPPPYWKTLLTLFAHLGAPTSSPESV